MHSIYSELISQINQTSAKWSKKGYANVTSIVLFQINFNFCLVLSHFCDI